MKSPLLAMLLMFLTISAPEVCAEVNRTIYLLRHAEKQTDESKDPLLTVMGQRRALNIAKMLKNRNISTIYSSDFNRTKQTAQPLAELLGLTVTIYDPAKLEIFAKQLLRSQGNLLIVGHSNTTPGLASLLGGEDFGEIDHLEYHRVYQLSFDSKTVKSELLFSKPIQTEYLK